MIAHRYVLYRIFLHSRIQSIVFLSNMGMESNTRFFHTALLPLLSGPNYFIWCKYDILSVR
jgi:hypothetical protein